MVAKLSIFCWVLGLMIWTGQVHADEKRVALVIGNSQYQTGALKNPGNDASDFRDRLKALGFREENIVFRQNLRTSEIGPTLREFKGKLEPDAVALVFYAGHGLQVKGENYFPTVDSVIEGEEDVPQQSLKLSTLMQLLADSKSRVNIVFLDACRNNPFKRSFRDASRGLARSSEEMPSGTLVVYATRANDVASDGNGRNGTFTSALLTHMAEPGLPIEQVFKRVIRTVKAETKGAQEPWQEGSLEGDFFFVPGLPTAVAQAEMSSVVPALVSKVELSAPVAGTVVKDCAVCPELVYVPGGSFMMGSPASEAGRNDAEGPQHIVNIKPFYLGKFEVTQGQWKAIMGNNRSQFDQCGDDCPVEQVSWKDAREYVRRLKVTVGKDYRLPSESEWEYAARAGNPSKMDSVSGGVDLPAIAWFSENSQRTTHLVGAKSPNVYGIFDMLGNVWEWTADAWHDDLTGAPDDGEPWITGGDTSRRVIKGGSWNFSAKHQRPARRFWAGVGSRDYDIGFRIAREP
jgi:formylglycine-generating enzyme required for sulfatase activity